MHKVNAQSKSTEIWKEGHQLSFPRFSVVILPVWFGRAIRAGGGVSTS